MAEPGGGKTAGWDAAKHLIPTNGRIRPEVDGAAPVSGAGLVAGYLVPAEK